MCEASIYTRKLASDQVQIQTPAYPRLPSEQRRYAVLNQNAQIRPSSSLAWVYSYDKGNRVIMCSTDLETVPLAFR
jgi:hypothetical protein